MSESVANSIGALPSSDSIIVGGNTGRTEKVTKGTIPMLQIGNNTIKNISVITVPDNQLDFGFDKEGNKLSVNGFLGWNVINKFKWMINPLIFNFYISVRKIKIFLLLIFILYVANGGINK
nr:hypothetical protein [Keratinibaculum paraultunense]